MLTHGAIEQAPLSDPLQPDNEETLAVPTKTYGPSSSSGSPSRTTTSPNHESSSAGMGHPSWLSQDHADVLRPAPGEEDLYNVANNPFAFCPGQLSKLLNPKSIPALLALGGLSGLEKGLRTDKRSGLSTDETRLSGSITFEEATGTASDHRKRPEDAEKTDEDTAGRMASRIQVPAQMEPRFADRKRVFGQNRLPERKPKSFLQLAWMALQDKVLILLSIAAAVSLALGLYETFGQPNQDGAKVGWIEGVAIILAVLIVVVVGALNDWQKERQFRKLNRKKEDRLVKVVRSAQPVKLSVHNVLVGDVMLLEQGDILPVDGVLIDGQSVSCDEASATGESDLVRKTPAIAALQSWASQDINPKKLDPFLLSGAKVLDGVGSFVVTAVGPYSTHGRTMMALRDDPGLTPLQAKLSIMAGELPNPPHASCGRCSL